jgi:large subunit ribosomal protein L10
MPLTRQQKEDLVQEYSQGLAKAPHVFLVDYKGVTVTQVSELRNKVREVGGQYEVVKNRLVLRAIGGEALEELSDQFEGPTAVAYCGDDPVGLAKAVTEFAKEVPAIELKGGLVEGQSVAAEDVKEIAQLPSREALLSKLVFLLQSPISSFVRTLAALPREFVVVLEQVRQKKESAG